MPAELNISKAVDDAFQAAAFSCCDEIRGVGTALKDVKLHIQSGVQELRLPVDGFTGLSEVKGFFCGLWTHGRGFPSWFRSVKSPTQSPLNIPQNIGYTSGNCGLDSYVLCVLVTRFILAIHTQIQKEIR